MHLPLAFGLFSLEELTPPPHTHCISLPHTPQNQHRIRAHLPVGCLSPPFLLRVCTYKTHTHSRKILSFLNHPFRSFCHCVKWVSNLSVHSRSRSMLVIKAGSLTMTDVGKDV